MGDRPRRSDKARGKAPVGGSSRGRREDAEESVPQDESPWLHLEGEFFPDLPDPREMTRKELEKIIGFRSRATSPSWGIWSSICYNGLLMIRMQPTRIIDPAILRRMGIYDQVVGFLDRVGLGTLYSRHYSFYPEIVRQCIASAEVVYETPSAPLASEGRLVFFYQGERHEISITRICRIFGFDERVERCEFDSTVVAALRPIWEAIGSGPYSGKSMKHTLIRNPVLTIAAKLISTTLYAKQEASALRTDELYLLCLGLQREVFCALMGLSADSDFELERVNIGAIFASILAEQKFRVIGLGNTPRMMVICSLLTPIFDACGIDLTDTERSDACSSTDAGHMRQTGTFQIHGRRGVYHYRDVQRHDYYVRLPSHDWAGVDDEMQVRFLLPQELFCTPRGDDVGDEDDAPVHAEPRAAPRRSASRASSSRAPPPAPYIMPDFEMQPRPTTPPPSASPAEHRLHQSRVREHSMDGLLWRAMRHVTRCFRPPRVDERPAPQRRKRRHRSPAEE